MFINGSSGEGYMLTVEERMKLAEKWISVASEGFRVIVHVGATCIKDCYRMAEHAQGIGAFGIGAMASPFPKAGGGGAGAILRRDCLWSSDLSRFYFSIFPALRRLPAHVALPEAAAAHPQPGGNQVYLRKYLRIQPMHALRQW